MLTPQEIEKAAEKPLQDPFYDLKPEKMWLGITNIGVRDEGMVRVILQVNGVDKELYHSYVVDGTVSQWHNLTPWLHKSGANLVMERVRVLEATLKEVVDEFESVLVKVDRGSQRFGIHAIHKARAALEGKES